MRMFNFPMEYIFYLNIAVAVFYVIMFYFGYRKGFLYQVLVVLGSLVAFFASWRYAPVFAARFSLVPEAIVPKELSLLKTVIATYANELLWYFILFFALKLLFSIITKIIQKIRNIPVIKQVSGLLGGLLGLVTATVWVLVFCVFLNTSVISNGHEVLQKSVLGKISSMTSFAISSFSLPEESSETFHHLISDAQNLEDKDKKALNAWLDEHGFTSIEELINQDEH